MKILYWILVLPFLVVVGLFAMANRQIVTVGLWPFVGTAAMPLFVAVTIAVVIGFLLGGLAAWRSGRGARLRARHAERRANRLAAEVERLQTALASRPVGEVARHTGLIAPSVAPPAARTLH